MGIELVKTTRSIEITKNKATVEVAAPDKQDLNEVYNNGINKGYYVGYDAGLDTGYNNGYNEGKSDGVEEDYNEGYGSGFGSGYDTGYSAGKYDGEASGYNNGYSSGYDDGYWIGYDEGEWFGYSVGYDDGLADGLAQGGSSDVIFSDAFWEAYQIGGNRMRYDYAFAEQDSNFEFWSKGFTPKYPLNFSNESAGLIGTFYCFGAKARKPIDFDEFITKNNIQLKLTRNNSYKDCITVGKNAFYGSYFSHLPRLYTSQLIETFRGCTELVTIDFLYFSSSNSHSNPFISCSKLKNITFGGVNKSNGLSFSGCNQLTVDTILSLFSVLYDYSGTTTKRSLTLGSTNLAKLTDEQKAIATDKGWTLA